MTGPKSLVEMPAARAGILLACACAILTACAILIGAVLLRTMSPLQMVTYVYAFGTLWHATHCVIRRRVIRPTRPMIVAAVLMGGLDAVYNVALLSGLAVVGAAVHGFYSLLGELLAAALGILVLRERYSLREALAGLFLVLGLCVVRARSGVVGDAGLLWMLLAAAAFGASAVLARRVLRRESPTELAFYRTAVAVALLAGAGSFAAARWPTPRELILLSTMGFVGPFLNALLFYHALKRLQVGRVVTLRMGYVILVPLGATILLSQPIRAREVVGGVIMLAAAVVMIRERERLRSPADGESVREARTT